MLHATLITFAHNLTTVYIKLPQRQTRIANHNILTPAAV